MNLPVFFQAAIQNGRLHVAPLGTPYDTASPVWVDVGPVWGAPIATELLPRMSLYVWEGQGVLSGTYEDGMIVAVADSLEAARAAARVTWGTDSSGSGGLEDSLNREPEVIPLDQLTGTRAWLVAGA